LSRNTIDRRLPTTAASVLTAVIAGAAAVQETSVVVTPVMVTLVVVGAVALAAVCAAVTSPRPCPSLLLFEDSTLASPYATRTSR